MGVGSYGTPLVHDFSGRHRPAVSIGNYCSIASEVTFLVDGNHRLDWVTTYPIAIKLLRDTSLADGSPRDDGPVRVGHDVWLGYRSTVLGGCSIGTGAVVATGALVVKDVRPYAIVAGVPAREIARRFDDETCEELLAIPWWELEPDAVASLHMLLSATPDTNALRAAVAGHSSQPSRDSGD